MTWLLLGLAIVLEVVGTTCLKLSHGYSRLVPTVLVFVFYRPEHGRDVRGHETH